MIIYLHGLNSSPLSSKGVLLAEYCAARGIDCAVPQLHHRPRQAADQIAAMLQGGGSHTLVGSSMGGYYATWFCERQDNVRAVLVNPALRLAAKLIDYVGKEQQQYHRDDTYLFTDAHVQELRELEVDGVLQPDKYILMVQTGDDVLDYREAVEYYAGARQIVEEGGDHSFVGFECHLPMIAAFASGQ